MSFLQFMFAPAGQPWYAGAFWSNQTQWTVVTLPVFILSARKIIRGNKRRHEDLKAYISAEHQKSRQHYEKLLAGKRK